MAELWLDKDGMPRQIKTTEPNNDWTMVLLFNLEKNITISLKSFEIIYPNTIQPTPA
jgi:outer membrane lipoprotein-sorting protein